MVVGVWAFASVLAPQGTCALPSPEQIEKNFPFCKVYELNAFLGANERAFAKKKVWCPYAIKANNKLYCKNHSFVLIKKMPRNFFAPEERAQLLRDFHNSCPLFEIIDKGLWAFSGNLLYIEVLSMPLQKVKGGGK